VGDRSENVADALGGSRATRLGVGHGEELPDAVLVTGAPRTVGDEPELEETRERAIDTGPIKAEQASHSVATIEGRTLEVGGQSEQDEDSRGIGTEAREPAVV
jgi:hypothetical protein